MWSTPLIRPFATDGAAPSTTTNMIAASDSPNRRIANGNQAIEGIVCSPVINDATAVRSTFQRTMARPMSVPIARARA